MRTYHAPLRDMRFVLFDVLGAEPLFQRLGYTEATRDIVDAVLEEGARFTESVLAPLNQAGDRFVCRLNADTGEVTTPPGFREAYAKFAAGAAPKKVIVVPGRLVNVVA